MVHWLRSSMPTSSWTSSTTYKSSRWIPVHCSTSIWRSHICVYLWPSRVHCCNRILRSAHQSSPFRILLSEFTKFLLQKCSLIRPLPSRMGPVIMFFHICHNEVIRFRVVDVFVAPRNTSVVLTIGIILSWSWPRTNTSSSTSTCGYILFRVFLL